MILIHAYDHRAAYGIAGRLGLRSDDWKYVVYEKDILGNHGVPLFVANDAYRNRDHDRIMQTARDQSMWIWREG